LILIISSINVCQWAVQSVAQHLKNFLHFCTGLQRESNSENLDHYLDDFFFAGKANSNDCQSLMTTFINICKKLQVPIADEKTEGPTCDMEYLGLTIDTREMTVQIPDKKMKELLVLIREVAFSKKVTLKKLQSLCGVLAFCTRAIPAGIAFSRRLCMATSKARKPFHLIRIPKKYLMT
jgi:hypothetical protein